MHILVALGAAALLAAAPKLGERTHSPAEVLAQLGDGSSDAEMARLVAAASAYPLGSLQNPLRVGGPVGRRAYVARLRCANGSQPAVGPASAAGVGGFGSVVEGITLDCGVSAPGKVQLFLDLYHEEHQETRAPQGFILIKA